MLKDERQEKIIQIIIEKGFVKNKTLSEITNSTIQTIIADVNELAKEGKIIKVYGGAKSTQISSRKMQEPFDEEKEKLNIAAKNKIAKKAVELIEEGDLIFLDTGTSTKQMVKYLVNKNVSIVTNGYSIAIELVEQDNEVCLVGGKIVPSTHATVGEMSLKFIDNFFFDKVFIGMNNFDQSKFYTTNLQEAMIKEKVIKNSEKSFIVMDSSKFYNKNRIKVDVKTDTTLISEQSPSDFKGKFISA